MSYAFSGEGHEIPVCEGPHKEWVGLMVDSLSRGPRMFSLLGPQEPPSTKKG